MKVSGQRTLLLTAVGNRPDEFIIAAASAIAGPFDHYICSNHTSLRGRQPDDVPALLRAGLLQGGVAEDKIRCIADFTQALDAAIADARTEDLLVVSSYATDVVMQRLALQQA